MSESAKPHDPESTPQETGSPYHLDLPDGRDFVSRPPSRMPLDTFLNWVEEMRRMFPMTERQREIREQRRCTEEFIL